jgi:hypothetical protein
MGLSWHRGGRSISVPTWLERLSVQRAAARHLPRASEIEPAPARARPLASFKAATTFALLLVTVSVWVSLKSRGLATMAAHSQTSSQASAVNVADTTGAALADFGPIEASLGNVGAFDAQPHPAYAADAAAQPEAVKRDANRTKSVMLDPIVVSARNYRIRSGENFAEIHVRRASQRPAGDAAFVWWTEGASAKPGIDYVQQGKVTQLIPRGKNSATFFIKLLPTASRSQDQVFYIAIADAGSGAPSRRIERTAVWLPPTHNRS